MPVKPGFTVIPPGEVMFWKRVDLAGIKPSGASTGGRRNCVTAIRLVSKGKVF